MYILNIEMDDAPHIDSLSIGPFLERFPAWEREARRTGKPRLGSGKVYPFPIEEIMLTEGFMIPDHWLIHGGLDIGNSAEHYTAYSWIAKNPETGVYYLYDEYKQTYEKPMVHAQAILMRGYNVPTAYDCSANTNQHDQVTISELYNRAGISDMHNAVKTVVPGIMKIWTLISTGKFKVFPHCISFKREYMTYSYDKGKIKKWNDDMQDSVRYNIMGHDEHARRKDECAVDFSDKEQELQFDMQERMIDMGRDDVGGY